MSRLSEYTSLSEKTSAFSIHNIDTSQELNDFIYDIEASKKIKKMIFRGMPEARYKLYTSAQRKFATEELDRCGHSIMELMQSLIDNAKIANNKLLSRYFKAFGITLNDFLVLSFLQHYGAPSTLIDFTYNLYTGLFFCTDGLTYTPSDRDIDNYFSLYIIDLESSTELCSLIDVLENSFQDVNVLLKDNKRKHPSAKIDTSHFEEIMTTLPYKDLKNWKLFYLPGARFSSNVFRVSPNLMSQLHISNLNLIAQDGLFVHLGDDTNPLESFFSGQTNPPINSTYRIPKMTCVNIHKSLREHIRYYYLKPKNKIKARMYPQEESIAKDTYTNFLINI